MFRSLHPALAKFLRDRNLWFAFRMNMISNPLAGARFFHLTEDHTKPTEYAIIQAFAWSWTNEGFLFWNEIDNKWRIYHKFLNL